MIPTPSLRKKTIGPALLLGLAALLAAAPATAAVYRWVDAKGGLHFSQTPPADRSYETLPATGSGLTTVPSPGEAPKAGTPSDTSEFLRRAAEADQKKREKALATRTARDTADAQCVAAQERLRFLDEHPPNRLVQREPGGETRRVDSVQWEKERAAAREGIGKSCR